MNSWIHLVVKLTSQFNPLNGFVERITQLKNQPTPKSIEEFDKYSRNEIVKLNTRSSNKAIMQYDKYKSNKVREIETSRFLHENPKTRKTTGKGR